MADVPVPPRRVGRDVDDLGADLQRAVRADIRHHRRRGLAGATLAAVVAVAGLGGPQMGGPGAAPSRSVPETTAASAVPPPTGEQPVSISTTVAPPEPPPPGQVPDPASLLVLVDRQRFLPPGYEPAGLVEAAVPFTFSGPHPKRLLRPEAARALEGLFAAAAGAWLPLVAVSGYRSEQAQRDVFSAHAAREGAEVAGRTTARPGHSEHQTGLAVDVTGADGACAASDCFGGRPEAAWLAAHAHEHGFVIRYPLGKEAVTGYDYEPWHLRYVGTEGAGRMADRGLTLDEYLGAGPEPPR